MASIPSDIDNNSAGASSERIVSETAISSLLVVPNSLSTAHHFVSIKLTSCNFLFWRTQLVPFLQGQNLLGFVDGSVPCPSLVIRAASGTIANPCLVVWVQQDQAILSMIISSMYEEVMHLAIGQTRGVWQSIEKALASSSRTCSLNLLSQLQSLM